MIRKPTCPCYIKGDQKGTLGRKGLMEVEEPEIQKIED